MEDLSALWIDPLNIPTGSTVPSAVVTAATAAQTEGLPSFDYFESDTNNFMLRLNDKGVVLHMQANADNLSGAILEFLTRWK